MKVLLYLSHFLLFFPSFWLDASDGCCLQITYAKLSLKKTKNKRKKKNMKPLPYLPSLLLFYFFLKFIFSQFFSNLKEKRQQLLNEIRTLCEACCYPGLVEFHGAFYTPCSGQISIALEYMDGGSLADILRVQKSIAEPVLAHMVMKLLKVRIHALPYCLFYQEIGMNSEALSNSIFNYSILNSFRV